MDRRRALTIAVVVVVVAIAGWFGYQRFFASARSTEQSLGEEITVERGTILATVNASGSVQPNRQVSLSFRTVGTVEEIFVDEGESVEEGAPIARLESDDLELAVRQAEAGLAAAEAQLRRLTKPGDDADVAAVEAALRSAQANLERVQEGANPQEIAAARANLSAAQEALNALLAGPDEAQVAQAAANVKSAEAALKTAQAAYDRVKWRDDVGALPESTQLEQATIEFERARVVYQDTLEGPSQQEIQQARAQVAQAQANLDTLLESPTAADIAAAESQVRQAEANLAQVQQGASAEEIDAQEAQVEQARISLAQAERNLAGAELTAPFSGTVASLNIKEQETVAAGTPAVVVADFSRFELEVSVDELDIGRVAVGDPVTITLDAYRDEPMRGSVIRVASVPAVDEGVVSYPVRIELDLDTAPGPLRAGLTASVDIVTQRLEDVLTLPNRAISIDRNTGEIFVLTQENGETVRTEIELGLRDDEKSEIRAGLDEGDTVIIPDVDRREELRQQFGG